MNKSKIFIVTIFLLLASLGSAQEEIKAFTQVGDHTWDVPNNVNEVTVLVVAGGGGGGNDDGGGGGGAGGLVYDSDYSVSGTVSVEVGDGGSTTVSGSTGRSENGEDSSFGDLLAEGGGGSGGKQNDGKNGGSGGGAGQNGDNGGSATQPGTNSNVDNDAGNDGVGRSGSNSNCNGGCGDGGGGAGEPGQGSDGGDGLYFGDIYGEEYGDNGWFAGGGAGGDNRNGGSGGNFYGGKGGGGNSLGGSCPQDGMPNTGGGGGGSNYNSYEYCGGNGGSGIVIIKYSTGTSICDRRGPSNECISNSTHEISNEYINISSIFQSEASATFESFNGIGRLNLTNSSSISGLWKGSITIEAERPRLLSGASFRPQGERIIIGK